MALSRKLKYIIVAAVVLAAVFAGSVYGGLLSIPGIGVDHTLHTNDFNGFHFGGWFTNGNANSHTGDMLDSAQYVSAFAYNDYSEKVVAEAVFCKSGLTGWQIVNSQGDNNDPGLGNAFRYDVYLITGVTPSDRQLLQTYYYPATFNGAADCGKNQQIPSSLMGPFQMKGPQSGILEVDMSVFMWDTALGPFGAHGWYGPAVWQQSGVVSGAGSCSFVGPAGVTRPALTGEDLTVQCDLGVAISGKQDQPSPNSGWTLWGSWQPSQAVASFGNGPAIGAKATFAAPAYPGIYYFRLLNALFIRDAYDFSVNVNSPNATANAPPMPSLSVDPQPAWATGTTVTLSWKAEPNANTQSPIVKVWVHVFYQSSGANIIPLTSFDGAEGSTQFMVGENNDIRITVISQDQSGLYSVQNEPTFQTYGCDINNTCRPPPGPAFGVPLWLVIVIIAAFAALIAFFVDQIPFWPWKVLVYFIAVILVLVAIIVYPR